MLSTVASEVILERIRRPGDEEGWRQFAARYEPVLFAFTRRAGLQEADARDLVQQTLLTFLETFQRGTFDREKGRLRSWLQGIIINKLREARRAPGRREIQVEDHAESTAFMERVPDEHEWGKAFDEEWERGIMGECLTEVAREVDAQTFEAFRLYAMEDWAADKVAEHLGISRNAVYISKTRVLSRMRTLRQEMTELW